MVTEGKKRMAQFSFCNDGYDAAADTGTVLFLVLQIHYSHYRLAGICIPE